MRRLWYLIRRRWRRGKGQLPKDWRPEPRHPETSHHDPYLDQVRRH